MSDQTNLPRVRGCGLREQNAMYITVPSSRYGKPLSTFLIDPPLKWEGPQLRAPLLVPDPQNIYHILLGIGKQFYPYFSDFFEEAIVLGVSKRIANKFSPEKLTLGNSKFLLIHPRGIPKFAWRAPFNCPSTKHKASGEASQKGIYMTNFEDCVDGLWPLSAAGVSSKKHLIEEASDGKARITTPSVTYYTPFPEFPPAQFKHFKRDSDPYNAGILLSFPTFSFEWTNRDGNIPKDVKERFSTTRFRLEVVPD